MFDRAAEGWVISCFTVVDDDTHEAVAIRLERAISGHGVSRFWINWPYSSACHEYKDRQR